MKKIVITQDAAGQRLDRYLAKRFPGATKGFLQKMLRKKNIKVNGMRGNPAEMLREGDEISVYFSDETIDRFSKSSSVISDQLSSEQNRPIPDHCPEWLSYPIFQDQNLLAVNKPAGLLTQPDATGAKALSDFIPLMVSADDPTFHPAPANRLDRNTSGIVLIPKNYQTQKQITAAIRERKTRKDYRVLVKGILSSPVHLSDHLTKNDHNLVSVEKNGDGKEAILDATPLAHHSDTTLLQVQLHTGRSHQIRVQLSAMGHPIIGDPKYGDQTTNQYFYKKTNLSRQWLHCCHYAFPTLGIDITAPLPSDLMEVLQFLGYQEHEL